MVGAPVSAEVHICGRLQVEWNGERLEEALAGPQLRLLFAYLTLHRERPVRRDELVEALWSGAPPSDGDALLRPLLSRLRRALGQDRLEGRSALELRFPEDTWVDFEAVGAQLRTAREAQAAGAYEPAFRAAGEAIAIADAGLLPGLEAAWLEPVRSELEDLRCEALEARAAAGGRLGPAERAEAETAARRAVELSPYRESARASLIEVLHRRANTAEALVAYEQVRSLLRDELGSAPGPELRALHAELLRAQDAAAPASTTAAPALPQRLVQAAETRWVGRDAALAQLHEAAERAAAGRSEVVVVAGQGGIGKTRLVAELASSLVDFDVLYGRCDEEQLFPYGPWVELLRAPLARMDNDELRATLGSSAVDVARLLPGLQARLPEAVDAAQGDSETQRRQLFEAVTRILGTLSRRRPVLAVLDDLHWADRSSLLLARHVAGEPQLGPVLLLGTLRDTELDPGHPLPELIADIERHRAVPRVRLGGMDDAEVGELVGALHGAAVAERTVRAIREQTDGNPFFVKHLVSHLEEAGGNLAAVGGMTVPQGVRDVIARRVSRLPAEAGHVLRVAALMGREFDFDLLAGVVAWPEETLLDVLDAAVRGALLEEVAPGRYSFAHALLRTALESELTQTRRARLHKQIGEVIEARRPDRLDELARHFQAAGSDRAISYTERAAQQAIERLAYDEAAELLEQAVALCGEQEPPDPRDLARLEHALATAQTAAGQWVRARTTFARSAAAARRAADPEALALAALGHGGGMWEQVARSDRASVALLEEALAGLPETDSVLRVRVLARLVEILDVSPASDEHVIGMAWEALAMARRLDDLDALLAALMALQFARLGPGLAGERLPLADELLAVAEARADPVAAADAHVWRGITLLELCRIDEAKAHFARHAELAERTQLERQLVHRDGLRALVTLLEGDFEAAAAIAQEVFAWGQRTAAHGPQPGTDDVALYAQQEQSILLF
jgi:DNA-binding SARP family transcriptional activator